jgi:purine-binding chemotaxis protein CheW
MSDSSYILFCLDRQRYALCMDILNRIVQRPELTQLLDSPSHIAGLLDLAGKMVPVLDLSVLLAGKASPQELTDSIIVLEVNDKSFGVIATEVKDLITVSLHESQPNPNAMSPMGRKGIVEQAIRVDGDVALVLDARKLSEFAATSGADPWNDRTTPPREVSPQEQKVFHERANALASQSDEENHAILPEVVVVGIGGEYFGLPVRGVREFCETRSITPVPCCPDHISGCINLRGEILVVMDLRSLLGEGKGDGIYKKVVVIEEAGITVGLGIEEIYDVVPIDTMQLSRLPLTAGARADEYISGVGAWDNHSLMILDCHKLLSSAELVVEEEV